MVLRVVMGKIQTLATGCSKNSRGFTLIELLVSIIIIGLVSSIIFINSSVLDSLEKNTGALKNLFNYLSEESMLSGSMIGFYAKNNKIDTYMLSGQPSEILKNDIDELSYNCEFFHTVEVMTMMLFYDIIHQTDNKCPSIRGEKVRLKNSSLRGGVE